MDQWRTIRAAALTVCVSSIIAVGFGPSAVAVVPEADQALREFSAQRTRYLALHDSLVAVNQKIPESVPALALPDAFEGDDEYFSRASKALAAVRTDAGGLRNIEARMKELFQRRFETSELKLEATPENYNPNSGKWTVTVIHEAYERENFEFVIDISRDQARLFHEHLGNVSVMGSLAVDYDEKVRLTGIRIAEANSGYEVDLTPPIMRLGPADDHEDLTFTADGRFLAIAERWTVYSIPFFVDNSRPERTQKILDPNVHALSTMRPSNFGHVIAVSGREGICVIDAETGKVFNKFAGDRLRTTFGPLDKWIVAGNSVMDRRLGREILKLNSTSRGLIDPFGQYILYSSKTHVKMHDLVNDRHEALLRIPSSYRGILLRLSADGGSLATFSTVSNQRETRFFDVDSGREIGQATKPADARLELSRDGNFVALADRFNVKIRDLRTSRVVWNNDSSSSSATAMAFSPEGAYLAVLRVGGYVELYRIEAEDPPGAGEYAHTAASKPPATGVHVQNVTLDVDDWDSAQWMDEFMNNVLSRWKAPYAYRIGTIEGETTVSFVVALDGQISEIEVLAQNGHQSLHDAMVTAIAESSGSKPLPADFPSNAVKITADIVYPVKE